MSLDYRMDLERKNERNREKNFCECCDYLAGSNADYSKHIMTAKHQKMEKENDIESARNKKRTRFVCDGCSYSAIYESDYNRHIMTDKHKKMEMTKEKERERERERLNVEQSKHICKNCNKSYKSPSGLWNHKKKCLVTAPAAIIANTMIENTTALPNNMLDFIVNILKTNEDIKQLMVEQMKTQMATQKLQAEQNIETQKQLIQLAKEPRNTNSNNTLNNHFNLQFFLNETCKDAINVSDFVENIKIDFCDVENVGTKGYIAGITDMIVKNLNDLGMTKRPFHCTDTKRETIYIKDNNKWDKDNETKEKFQMVLNQIYEKNWNTLRSWSKANPDIRVLDSRENKLYHKILEQTDCIKGMDKLPETNEKIIRRLSDTIRVDRETKS